MTEEVTAFIALGSNLDNPCHQVQQAIDALARLPGSTLAAVSPWYRSTAVGPGEQPDYLNGVAKLRTRLDPHSLLASLQAIEKAQGRQRNQRWGARTLDLDILLYGTTTLTSKTLTIPHPRMVERNFVLYPLADLAPALLLPDHTPLCALLAKCSTEGIVRATDGD